MCSVVHTSKTPAAPADFLQTIVQTSRPASVVILRIPMLECEYWLHQRTTPASYPHLRGLKSMVAWKAWVGAVCFRSSIAGASGLVRG